MANNAFWHPTRNEWKYLCAVREDLDPEHTLFTKDGNAIAIWLADKPVEDIAKGKALLEKRQAEELARSDERCDKA